MQNYTFFLTIQKKCGYFNFVLWFDYFADLQVLTGCGFLVVGFWLGCGCFLQIHLTTIPTTHNQQLTTKEALSYSFTA